jgi:hypothetical protein
VRNTTPDPVEVSLPTGLFFVAGRRSAQNMVGTASRSVMVAGGEWTSITVPAACANKPRDIPTTGDRFTIQRSPVQRELGKVLPALEQAGAPYPVVQAAIWILTDNASFEGLGTLIRRPASQSYGGTRVIDEATGARAIRIMADAGVDVTHRAIWRDRQRIAAGVGDPDSAAWLRGK